MLPHIHQYDEIIRTLHCIQAAGFSSALIAGGAVRDLYFDILPTDIDIFVWDPRYSDEPAKTVYDAHPDKEHDFWWNTLKLTHKPHSHVPDEVYRVYDDEYGVGGFGKITAVINVMKNFIPLQIIFTELKPIEHVNQYFDIGLCKAYCDGTKLRYTPDFMQDKKNKTFTIVGKDMTQEEFDYILSHHVPKLQHKYPGYKVCIAPWNQRFVASHTKTVVY